MSDDTLQPLDSAAIPRFAEAATFMRAQLREDPAGLDIAMAGVPFDWGSTNRAGARHGPAQMREMSRLIRQVHFVTKLAPFQVCRIADVGDAPVNPLDLMGTLETVQAFFERIHAAGALPLSAGGDHTIALPILRAIVKDGPVGMLQFDSHSDTHDVLLGHKYNHGTCFRRAIEEGIVDPKRLVQIGIRGTLYSVDEHDWARSQGVTMITIEDFFEIGVAEVIEKTRSVLGDGPVYITFDIDGLDPIYAPGTGAPEPGGLSIRDAQVILRGMQGLNLIGADVNECSPPLDPTGNTALVACNLMFEELCLLADAVRRRKGQ
ncbi:MAG: agmatinase [Acidiferrobacterales bacterium]